MDTTLMGEGKFKQLIQYRFYNDKRLIAGGPDMPYVTGDILTPGFSAEF